MEINDLINNSIPLHSFYLLQHSLCVLMWDNLFQESSSLSASIEIVTLKINKVSYIHRKWGFFIFSLPCQMWKEQIWQDENVHKLLIWRFISDILFSLHLLTYTTPLILRPHGKTAMKTSQINVYHSHSLHILFPTYLLTEGIVLFVLSL